MGASKASLPRYIHDLVESIQLYMLQANCVGQIIEELIVDFVVVRVSGSTKFLRHVVHHLVVNIVSDGFVEHQTDDETAIFIGACLD